MTRKSASFHRPTAPARVTPELLGLYVRAKQLAETGKNDYGDHLLEKNRCVAQPYLGRPDMELHYKLGRRPWMCDIFDVEVDDPEPADLGDDLAGWRSARDLRIAFEAALAKAEAAKTA